MFRFYSFRDLMTIRQVKKTLKVVIPAGYFLGYEEIQDPNGWSFSEPVLVKNDPRRFTKRQAAAYFYPGRSEPMLYRNPVKGSAKVSPIDFDYCLHLADLPKIIEEITKSLPEVKAALDDMRETITVEDKQKTDQLKAEVQGILGSQYFLRRVSTMLGYLPVITKVNTSEATPCAHLYPGAQTDALDAAPKKDTCETYEMPLAEFNYRLFEFPSTIEDIKKAIVQLERPEKYISYFESK